MRIVTAAGKKGEKINVLVMHSTQKEQKRNLKTLHIYLENSVLHRSSSINSTEVVLSE
jgi:hypothetical protein